MKFSTIFFTFLLINLIALNGCGLKAPPRPYEEISIPSYINQYIQKEPSK